MKLRSAVLAIALLLFAGTSVFAGQNPEKLATEAAAGWLALTDGGSYAASWDEAAQLFKNAVPKEDWARVLRANRAPLGELMSRKLKSAKYMTEVPGAPDGQYVVIQFESSFKHKTKAVETITPMLDQDGRWRVSGYFIK